MAKCLHVATRKGLLSFSRKRGQWALVKRNFLGQPVSQVLLDSHDNTLYAALNLGHFGVKLHRSDDEGDHWREVSAPSYAGVQSEGMKEYSLKLIWTLVSDGTGTLWCGTIPGGLFHSVDRGEQWQLVQSLWQDPTRPHWFGGGYDEPGVHSICIDPGDTRRILAAVSCGGVWLTEDGGASWKVKCEGMHATYMPPEQRHNPVVQDPHRLVQCPAAPDHLWVQHHNGIFRSQNLGELWQEVQAKPSSFGFAVAVHPHDPETAWFVPAIKDEFRYPCEGRLLVNRTCDGGQIFEALTVGLPSQESFDLVYRHGLAVDESGTVLAMGSTTGNLWLTETGGDQWHTLSTHLPPVYAVVLG